MFGRIVPHVVPFSPSGNVPLTIATGHASVWKILTWMTSSLSHFEQLRTPDNLHSTYARTVLARGGFRLTEFAANNSAALDHLPKIEKWAAVETKRVLDRKWSWKLTPTRHRHQNPLRHRQRYASCSVTFPPFSTRLAYLHFPSSNSKYKLSHSVNVARIRNQIFRRHSADRWQTRRTVPSSSSLLRALAHFSINDTS